MRQAPDHLVVHAGDVMPGDFHVVRGAETDCRDQIAGLFEPVRVRIEHRQSAAAKIRGRLSTDILSQVAEVLLDYVSRIACCPNVECISLIMAKFWRFCCAVGLDQQAWALSQVFVEFLSWGKLPGGAALIVSSDWRSRTSASAY